MKKSRFTDSRIMEALKRVKTGIKVPYLCQELGISSALFYRWRQVWRHGCPNNGANGEIVGREPTATPNDCR